MGAPRRILVVDDNVDQAETLCALLQSSGHVVECVTDPRLAVAAARRLKPGVALLDIGMPNMDGYQLARALRNEFGEQLVIVALTAYGSTEHRSRASKAGFDAYVTKGVDPSTIEAMLDTLDNPIS